jgi:hypothetical protein
LVAAAVPRCQSPHSITRANPHSFGEEALQSAKARACQYQPRHLSLSGCQAAQSQGPFCWVGTWKNRLCPLIVTSPVLDGLTQQEAKDVRAVCLTLVTSVEWRWCRRGECLHPPLRGLISPVLCSDGGTTSQWPWCPFCDVCARECIHSVNHVVWVVHEVCVCNSSPILSPCSYASPIRWHSCCQAGDTCGLRVASSVTCRFAQETKKKNTI